MPLLRVDISIDGEFYSAVEASAEEEDVEVFAAGLVNMVFDELTDGCGLEPEELVEDEHVGDDEEEDGGGADEDDVSLS